MALNMTDKKYLASQILPEVEFSITSIGITLSSSRLSTPRFVPYDQAGKCRECKSTEVELDFAITKEGVTTWCTRFNGSRFVPFDKIYDLPGHCFFKIRNKGRVFNINGSFCDVKCYEENKDMKTNIHSPSALPPPPPSLALPPPPPPSALPAPSLNIQATLSASKPQAPITLPAPLLSPPLATPPVSPPLEPQPPTPPTAEEGILNEFFDKLSAATTGIPTQAQKLEALKEQAVEMEKEEMEAIASIQ
uniref:Uncharacterized protein n=2 Tax=Meloidogyne TaxID=189290 RepID=A0A6V7WLD9_MELEN|nr:unnamed protein product [Meloidogyne enterolobii]CAD2187821.1 unnamed protein product [Meloidogyne enterolobii]CAD2208800.1 unnamed protein product [Meloidogyne enterolobii]